MNGVDGGFRKALLDPTLIPDGLSDGTRRKAGRRFDVYRNNIATSLTEALRIGFPVIAKLIGAQNMTVLCRAFVRAHPPSSPVMMLYGSEFPAFLTTAAQLKHLGYLPDIARLELAIRRAYHAGDADPIAADHLGRLSAHGLLKVGLRFAPAVQVLRSAWPIFDIWRFNTWDNTAKPRAVAQDVLITRPEFDPIVRLLPAGGATWIEAMMAGQNIEDALDQTRTSVAEFDMTAPLTLLLQGHAITSLPAKECP